MNSNKIAFLFAGQGAQYLGMGKELYDSIPECKEIFDKSEEILNMPIKDLIFNGPEEELIKTENAQPAIFVMTLAALKALELQGIEADFTAGLSLGEYAALIYSKVLNFEDALLLVKERGRIMGSSLPEGLGKMAAILKLDDEKMDELVRRASEYGICEGANYNCAGQVVIAGENEAIDKAIEIASELGGRGIALKVSGPFHSSLLKEASDEFYETIKESHIGKLEKKVYSNVLGAQYEDKDDIKSLLKQHIMSPVYFEKIIKDMIDNGVETFIEVGPGKALSSFVKKINRKANVFNVDTLDSLTTTVNKIKEVN